MTLHIELSRETEEQLKQLALEAGVPLDEFAKQFLEERLMDEEDARSIEIIERVVKRNAELYKRLA